MSSIKIFGGEQLKGELKVQGSKNAALPVLAAAVLIRGITILHNCPKILDVFHMINILEELGCKIKWEGNSLYINSSVITRTSVSEENVKKMRSSVLFLGALIGRFHEATISYPGGCSIGKRPINYHLKAFEVMNVGLEFFGEDDSIIHCHTKQIIGNDIFLEKPSVGATQNIILAAVLAKGVTRIYNAAREPEVTELCNYLIEAGAKIRGRGTAFLEIEGVKYLREVEYTLSPDRIVAGTYLTAVAATRGDVVLYDTPVRQLESVIRILRSIGCNIGITDDNVVRIRSNQRPLPIKYIKTKPYPGFPTDMQSQLMTVLCLAKGTSTIVEDIFESRFSNVDDLISMGANISVFKTQKKAVVTGVDNIHGATVKAHDLRAGAALVMAGLAAEGFTHVKDISCIERGYEDICRDFSYLGANIKYHKD